MENKDRGIFERLLDQEGAIERAYGAAQGICAPPLGRMLEPIRQSHRGQMAALARLLAIGETQPPEGHPADPLDRRAGPRQEALEALEDLEDGLVSAYQHAAERTECPYSKRVVEVDLLPAQLRSHEQMRQIERQGLEAPAWVRG